MADVKTIIDKIRHTDADIMQQIDGEVIRGIANTSINGTNSLEMILVMSFIYGYLQAKENVNEADKE